MCLLCQQKKSSAPVSRVLCRMSFGTRCLSFIYATSYPVAPAFYPPSCTLRHSDGQPCVTMVYANLQPPDGTARRSPAGWWSLTPPSHPYRCCNWKLQARRSFSSPVSSRCRLLAFSPVERPVLPGLSSRTLPSPCGGGWYQRQTVALLSSCQSY